MQRGFIRFNIHDRNNPGNSPALMAYNLTGYTINYFKGMTDIDITHDSISEPNEETFALV